MAVEVKNKGTKALFKNPILERLTRTHIAVPISLFIIYAIGLLYWSATNTTLSVGLTILLFLAGFLTLTWIEYNVHRYIFHMKPITKIREKIQYTMHGIHHEFPKDKDRLAMPPLLSITISTILLLFFKLIMGDLVFAFLPGILCGYAFYLFIHYIVHAYAPPKNFFKFFWVNHSVHHYKDNERVFGVSSPLWDYIYGTMLK
ncbi:MAG: fatty acid hydroxylase [Flammeovirgaceae bacterium]|nr:fatty acid hydroxylase [Flammeovirgaceae bacterium]